MTSDVMDHPSMTGLDSSELWTHVLNTLCLHGVQLYVHPLAMPLWDSRV